MKGDQNEKSLSSDTLFRKQGSHKNERERKASFNFMRDGMQVLDIKFARLPHLMEIEGC